MVFNHKNKVRHDNRVENLEWTTVEDNMGHAVGRPVNIIQLSTGRIQSFMSIAEASWVEYGGRSYSGSYMSQRLLNGLQLDEDYVIEYAPAVVSVTSFIEARDEMQAEDNGTVESNKENMIAGPSSTSLLRQGSSSTRDGKRSSGNSDAVIVGSSSTRGGKRSSGNSDDPPRKRPKQARISDYFTRTN